MLMMEPAVGVARPARNCSHRERPTAADVAQRQLSKSFPSTLGDDKCRNDNCDIVFLPAASTQSILSARRSTNCSALNSCLALMKVASAQYRKDSPADSLPLQEAIVCRVEAGLHVKGKLRCRRMPPWIAQRAEAQFLEQFQ